MKAPDMLTEGIEQLVSSLEQQELNVSEEEEER